MTNHKRKAAELIPKWMVSYKYLEGLREDIAHALHTAHFDGMKEQEATEPDYQYVVSLQKQLMVAKAKVEKLEKENQDERRKNSQL